MLQEVDHLFVHVNKNTSEMATGLRYQDKVAIVTGGCKGIGRGCVDVFGKFILN